MKKLMISSLLLLMPFTSVADEQEAPLSTFKCFIETDYGFDIAYFTWQAEKRVAEEADLLAKQVSFMSGKRGTVRHIEECKAAEDKFKGKLAKEMDELITD